jgi:uncharacterized membrane protein YbhN (UPF0104 family)
MLVPGSIPNMILSNSPKKRWFRWLKLFYKNTFFIALPCFIVAIVYLVFKISENQNSFSFLSEIDFLSITTALFTLLLLQFLNWILEAYKFKTLLQKYQRVSFVSIVKAIYAGVFTGLLTPERLGNFIGRHWVLQTDLKLTTLLTVIGNSFQLFVTIFISFLSISFLILLDSDIVIFHKNLTFFIFISSLVLSLVIAALLFDFRWLRIIDRLSFLTKWKVTLGEINQLSIAVKIKALFFALSRYLIFILQYYVLIVVFDVPINFLQLSIFLGLLYGIVTLVPSLIPGNLGNREAFCVLLLGGGLIGLKISFISFLVWLINVGFSALIGGLVILNSRAKQ